MGRIGASSPAPSMARSRLATGKARSAPGPAPGPTPVLSRKRVPEASAVDAASFRPEPAGARSLRSLTQGPPLCSTRRWKRPRAAGLAASTRARVAPADCPASVTREASPPKAAAFALTHSSARRMSYSA